MSLADHINIARRFQRAIRIDTDLADARALDGFICPQSSADVLLNMAHHVAETRQAAFTWTGPYGSGKSSLVVAISALLQGKADLREQATKVFGRKLSTSILKALPPGTRGWRIIPVVGRRDDPVRAIGEALQDAGTIDRRPRGGWSESALIEAATHAAQRNAKSHGGLIIFIDEMGKFLEGAAQDGTDIHVFQQLAEVASRSNGRLLIVGILHQAFDEYASRLSHQMRDEWAKIQGRFVDLPVNTAGEEQIDLISRAIESDRRAKGPSSLARTVASLVHRDRSADRERLATMLEACWPLHPVVGCLLGPISRRRFGQNQRSIFGFLNSAEPHGFQDFIRRGNERDLYGPEQLWDYLRANLEPSILASPDGHRWALAAEALDRCEAVGGDALHLKVLKAIAVIDLLKERSGLVPSASLLRACFPEIPESTLRKALEELTKWSLIIFKKYLDAYAVYAGSDFDIDQAVRSALDETKDIDFARLKALAGLQPILAKRHYHSTGALRWFDVNLSPAKDLAEVVARYKPTAGTIGQFVLAIPTAGEREDAVSELCQDAVRGNDQWDIVVGASTRAWAIVDLAREVIALEQVSYENPELAGDAVARREVDARLAALQGQLETELRAALDSAVWHRHRQRQAKLYRQAELNSLASELAERRFDQGPRIHNELLNRHSPSSNAIAAQNELLKRMVLNEGQERLGIDGFPAEGGLFASLLEATRLYGREKGVWRFLHPTARHDEQYRLVPLWDAAADLLKECTVRAEDANKRTVAVSELYDLWRRVPFGVKEGLMPFLAVAFILSQRNRIAVYRDGIFRARFDDVDVQRLAKDATSIQLRWMDMSDVARRLLSGMADIVRSLDQTNALVHLEPIDVARGLVAIYDQLPSWSKRTMRLSSNAVRVRDLFKRASDPNKFLFDDIPALLGGESSLRNDADLGSIVTSVREGLDELVQAYPSMLRRLKDVLLAELQVPNAAPNSIAELRARAANIAQLAGDFRLEAFVGRISHFDASDPATEGIASLAANKPPRDWADPDLDHTTIEIADLAQRFLRAETFARVKGRPEKRQAIALVIGREGRPAPMLEEFAVADTDRAAINDIVDRVAAALETADTGRRNVILAALAELSARYMVSESLNKSKPSAKRKVSGHG